MSGSNDSSQDTSPADQERVLCEPSEDVQSQNGDDPSPALGSFSLFRDGGFKFPKAPLEGGGFEILQDPICHGLQPFVLSESILDLNTSIEGVLLYMLEQASKNGENNWPELLISFSWFPRVLGDVGQAKRDARWQWITAHEPGILRIWLELLATLSGYPDLAIIKSRMIG